MIDPDTGRVLAYVVPPAQRHAAVAAGGGPSRLRRIPVPAAQTVCQPTWYSHRTVRCQPSTIKRTR